jgi:hypothetical protein
VVRGDREGVRSHVVRKWDEPLWLETTPEDPGRGQAKSAVSAGVDLVLMPPESGAT